MGHKVTQSEAGASDWVQLADGHNLVFVRSDDWGGSSAALEISPDGTSGSEGKLKDASGNQVTLTENGQDLISGDGEAMIRIVVSDYNAPVSLLVREVTYASRGL